jgi:multicomponent Na+:H+ antiporter subunit D
VTAPLIPVLLPVLIAALLALWHRLIPRALASLMAMGAALTVAAAALSMIVDTRFDPYVYSVGGIPPAQGPSLSLFFVVDNSGGMLVLIAALLTFAALSFATCYLPRTGARFQAGLLVFLAGASGVSLTGDLLNLVIFFEMLGLSAAALSRSYVEEPGPPKAARNLLLIHGTAAALLLAGVGLIFARTGALNLAQAGRVLATQPGPVTLLAFALVTGALLVQAAVVPFHLWFPEAVSLAPAPVSALLAGVLVEVGLYATVRIYWGVFSGALTAQQNDLRNILVCFGALTAVSGALMCFAERHLKRILAFAAVAQVGVALLGIALLTPEGLAGSSIFVMGFSVLIAGLFLVGGILLFRTGTYDEIELTARPRHLRWTGALFFAAGAGLAGLPPFGVFWGQMMLDGSAHRLGYAWIPWVSFFAAVLSAGSIFRFAGRAFFRWGPPVEEFAETSRPTDNLHLKSHHHTPAAMFAPTAALLILSAAAGLAPGLTRAAEAAALHVQNRAAYAQRILDLQTPYPPTVREQPATGGDLARGFGAVLAAALLAGLTLGSAAARQVIGESPAAEVLVRALRAVHSRRFRVQLAWMLGGLAALLTGALLLLG